MKILFVCRSNAERSQVAALLFNSITKKHTASSAGVNVAAEGSEGWGVGRIVTEIMLSMGYHEIEKARRTQLTKKMIDNADMVIMIMGEDEMATYLPDNLRRTIHDGNMKIRFWGPGFVSNPTGAYSSFPPPTYIHHTKMVANLRKMVGELVKDIG